MLSIEFEKLVNDYGDGGLTLDEKYVILKIDCNGKPISSCKILKEEDTFIDKIINRRKRIGSKSQHISWRPIGLKNIQLMITSNYIVYYLHISNLMKKIIELKVILLIHKYILKYI